MLARRQRDMAERVCAVVYRHLSRRVMNDMELIQLCWIRPCNGNDQSRLMCATITMDWLIYRLRMNAKWPVIWSSATVIRNILWWMYQLVSFTRKWQWWECVQGWITDDICQCPYVHVIDVNDIEIISNIAFTEWTHDILNVLTCWCVHMLVSMFLWTVTKMRIQTFSLSHRHHHVILCSSKSNAACEAQWEGVIVSESSPFSMISLYTGMCGRAW